MCSGSEPRRIGWSGEFSLASFALEGHDSRQAARESEELASHRMSRYAVVTGRLSTASERKFAA